MLALHTFEASQIASVSPFVMVVFVNTKPHESHMRHRSRPIRYWQAPSPVTNATLSLNKSASTPSQMRIGKALPLTDVQGRTLSLQGRAGNALSLREVH